MADRCTHCPRILRPTAIGGLLSLLFGITLIVSGISARDAGGLVPTPEPGCGTIINVGSVQACPTGTITVTKVVYRRRTGARRGFRRDAQLVELHAAERGRRS